MGSGIRGGALQKVLFIGNSFTARYAVPGLIAQLAVARGKGLQRRLISAGGASLRTYGNADEAQQAITDAYTSIGHELGATVGPGWPGLAALSPRTRPPCIARPGPMSSHPSRVVSGCLRLPGRVVPGESRRG